MRIVNKADFLAMPDGTVYAEYAPCYFGDIRVKRETISKADFFLSRSIAWIEGADNSIEYFDGLEEMQKNGNDVPLDFDCCERDGLYDDTQLYAVFSHDDVVNLCGMLLGIGE